MLKVRFLTRITIADFDGDIQVKTLVLVEAHTTTCNVQYGLEEVLQYKVYNESIFLFEEKRAAFCCKRLQKGGPSGDL